MSELSKAAAERGIKYFLISFTDLFGANDPKVPLRQRGRMYAEMLKLAYPAIKSANPRACGVKTYCFFHEPSGSVRSSRSESLI